MAKQKTHFEHLKHKWVKKHQKLQTKLWSKHKDSLTWLHQSGKQLVAGSLAGLLMLTSPVSVSVAGQLMAQNEHIVERPHHTASELITDLSPLLPHSVQPLTEEQEKTIGETLTEYFNMPVSASLQGNKLNRSYGYIGKEQHLMRYPGDTMATHFDTAEEQIYAPEGMAPGRGAWGYFAPSQAELTEQDKQREKYYIAVQTFLSPGWNEKSNELYNFFKYRKMLVVNAENGKAMVVVISDAGPAEWTGKHLGGSPEVMHYLERQDGGAKGPVLYFFINDPENKIPLGPVSVQ